MRPGLLIDTTSCCDLFVAAHLGNPCGHCFCGDCGWAWISKNKRSPTCSICRAPLSKAAPMIPNFVMDNMVDKHIQALGTSGMADWKEGGSKLLEWQARKEYVIVIGYAPTLSSNIDPQAMEVELCQESRRAKGSGETETPQSDSHDKSSQCG
ncbi:hypothetical protein JAAARDRAFT_135093 [Jaapia argillacea MUCL 33604]|uniref:RING-type domain-containing protein n=1 Tax=Jaapia argillacea MUCL 33604 TaxID=933084 RepID=A0A067PIX5_9AGAM|nr:hypothetical protein JAAARDRAFT_135093 [Jaapia argillacea MUCL 33604]